MTSGQIVFLFAFFIFGILPFIGFIANKILNLFLKRKSKIDYLSSFGFGVLIFVGSFLIAGVFGLW